MQGESMRSVTFWSSILMWSYQLNIQILHTWELWNHILTPPALSLKILKGKTLKLWGGGAVVVLISGRLVCFGKIIALNRLPLWMLMCHKQCEYLALSLSTNGRLPCLLFSTGCNQCPENSICSSAATTGHFLCHELRLSKKQPKPLSCSWAWDYWEITTLWRATDSLGKAGMQKVLDTPCRTCLWDLWWILFSFVQLLLRTNRAQSW